MSDLKLNEGYFICKASSRQKLIIHVAIDAIEGLGLNFIKWLD